jgi:hypothetical protein
MCPYTGPLFLTHVHTPDSVVFIRHMAAFYKIVVTVNMVF